MKKKERTKEYDRIHYWLRQNFGKSQCCENKQCCKISKVYDWVLKKGCNHQKKRNNYIRLCRKCHIKYDWNEQKTQRMVDIAHTPEANLARGISKTGVKRSKDAREAIRLGWRNISKKYKINSEQLTLREIAKKFNIKYGTLHARLNQYNKTIEEAIK